MFSEDAKKIEATLKLSEESRNAIDSLSKEELIQEINKKNRSRFQADKYAYLKTRLATIKHEEQQKERLEDVANKTVELTLAREANTLSHNANKLSKMAIFVSVVAALLALATLISNVMSNGNSSIP